MPEGHTIHRIARDHTRGFRGRLLQVSSPQGRFDEGAKKLDGVLLKSIEAHGKHLCYHWAGSKRLHIHLGLYGKFRHHRAPPPAPRGQVRLRVIGEREAFDLNGPSDCRLVSQEEWMAIRARLGPDPLRSDSDAEEAWTRIRRSRAPIGALLLDQSVIAGVGNIYRSEVLHVIGVHPKNLGKSLSREKFESLWSNLQRLLKIGVRYNRIITAHPEEVGKPLGRMNREERLRVYKRRKCALCDSAIDSFPVAARMAFACPRCQGA